MIDYADIGSALNQLQVLLEEIEDKFTELTDPLPAINKSISELLSLVDGYARGIDNINEAFAAATLALDPEQTDIPALRCRRSPTQCGAPSASSKGSTPMQQDSVGWVQLDFDTDLASDTNNMLLMDLHSTRASAPSSAST